MISQQDKYHLLVENLPDAFAYHQLVTNSEGIPVDYIFLEINSAFEKMTGLSKDVVIGKKFAEVYPAIRESPFDWIGTYAKVASSSETTRFEQYFEPAGRWCDITAYSDEPGCFAVVFRDLTEKKKVENALAKSEVFLRESQRMTKVGAWEYDCVSETFTWTDEVYKIYGVSKDYNPIDLSKLLSFYSPKSSELLQDAFWRTVKDGVPYNLELELTNAKGEHLWVRTRANPKQCEGKITSFVGIIMDVTERKKISEELRKSEAFIKSAMDNLPIGIAVNSIDPPVKFEYMNDNYCKFYRTTREALADPDSFWEAVYEDVEFREKIKQRVLDDCAGDDPERMYWEDVPLTHEGKGTFYITAKNIPIPNTSLVISTVWDVTKRKQAEIALRSNEESLSTTLNSIGDAVIATDDLGLIVRMNPAAEKLCGWPFSEAKGKSLTDVFQIIDSKTRKPALSPVDTVLEQGNVVGLANHTTLISRDGREYQIADSAAPIKNTAGIITGVVLVFADVSEDYALRKKLEESELRWKFALEEGSGDGIWDWNGKTNEAFFSRQWKRMLGYNENEIGSTIDEWYKRIHPEDKKKSKTDLNKHFSGKTATYRNEHRILCKDGLYKWVLARGKVIEWMVDGKPLRVIGTYSDITERKLTEEKIRYISFHDSLTGLYNRTYMEEEMKRLDTERQLPVGVIISDLNGLKLVNDTYGHSIGDEMLKQMAEVLKIACRQTDIIARWGGDEFVILLPQTTKIEALSICKIINDTCRKTYVEDIPISVALGIEIKESTEKSLSETLKDAENTMYKHKLTESRSAKSAVLNSLLKTLGAKSHETEEHTRRMKDVALKIGEKVDLPDTELNRLDILTKLHDIGKVNIPEGILTKKTALTQEEWEIIKKHPEIGYRIARATEEFSYVAEDILAHHERWDGSGYPQGLKGKEIPLLARITAIADSYEVMTNGRPYKKALSRSDVIDELKRCAGSHFDPELVEVFLQT